MYVAWEFFSATEYVMLNQHAKCNLAVESTSLDLLLGKKM